MIKEDFHINNTQISNHINNNTSINNTHINNTHINIIAAVGCSIY